MNLSALWSREPVAIVNAVRLCCLAAMTFGLHLTTEQLVASMVALEAVLTLFTRSQVTSPAGLQELTPKTLADAQDASQPVKDTVRKLPVVLLACVLGAGAMTLPACAATQPPPGTYSETGLKAFNADQLFKDVQALSETAINLNHATGKLHLSDRDTAFVRDFALAAGAGLKAYADGSGRLQVVVSAFERLSQQLSAEATLNNKLRFALGLVASEIHRIPEA